MSRWVEPKRGGLVSADAAGPESGEFNRPLATGWAERIVKYVPAEVLVAYTGLITVLGSLGVTDEQQPQLAGLLMGMFLVVTVVQVWAGAPGAHGVRRAHLIVSPVAFLAWSYSISACLLGSCFHSEVAFLLVAVAVALSIMLIPKRR